MGILDTLRRMFSLGSKPAPQKRTSDFSATYGNGNGGGFAGGAVGRLTASLATWSGSVNIDLDASLPILRARGRQMAQNNEHGRRFLTLASTNIVGPYGPTLQVRAYMQQPAGQAKPQLDKAANDAVEIHWARWCERAELTGRMDFAHLCRVLVKSIARDGEALVRKVVQPSLPYGMALQVLEADRLVDDLNLTLVSGSVRQGVEIDTAGRPVAYYIRTSHPGDRYATAKADIERVPASQILHLFLPERAEQVRGYTWFHAIILRAMQLHGFQEAAVVAARVGASKIAVLERAEGDSMPPPISAVDGQAVSKDQGTVHVQVEAGELFQAPDGYKLNSWNPEYPHANFESFLKGAMRGLSVGVDVANHNLSGDMTDVNYSSARIAELSERDVWMVLQSWFVRMCVKPVFEDWLALALLRGDITFAQSGKALPADKLSKFRDASRFQSRRWPWVDPQKEIEAASRAVELGITSRTRIAAERGDDFDDILDELRQESALLREANLIPVSVPNPQPQQPPAAN